MYCVEFVNVLLVCVLSFAWWHEGVGRPGHCFVGPVRPAAVAAGAAAAEGEGAAAVAEGAADVLVSPACRAPHPSLRSGTVPPAVAGGTDAAGGPGAGRRPRRQN